MPATAGDALAFLLNRDMQGTELLMWARVVREGTTAVAFLATPHPDIVSKVPKSVIAAQVAKLEN